MWHLRTWFRGDLGSAGQMLGLDHLKGLFQPKQLHGSVILLLPCCCLLPCPLAMLAVLRGALYLQEELGCGFGQLPCLVSPRDMGGLGGQQPFPAGSQVTHLQ